MEKAKILALLLSFLLTSCYEKYTMDYEHTAAYVATVKLNFIPSPITKVRKSYW